MAIVSLTIVKSRPRKDGRYNIKVALAHAGKTTYISTPYNVDNAGQFRSGRVIGRPDAAQLNTRLRHILDNYQQRIDDLPNALLTVQQVRQLVTHAPIDKPTIAQFAERFATSLDRQHRTSYAQNIRYTASAFVRCFGESYMFDGLTKFALVDFENHLRDAGQSDTTINIRMSHLKTLVNSAILAGVVTYSMHPFALYKAPAKAVREIALTREQLHTLRDAVFDDDASKRRLECARTLLLLSFCLGGVNLVDLMSIDFRADVAVYKRSKTGNEVRVTIPGEAKALAEPYIGAGGKLDFGYNFGSYNDFRSMVGRSMRMLREPLGIQQLCYYSARKTFVQLGYELGIPLYILEYAVGQTIKDQHQRPIYNYFVIMQREADAAIRKVLDYAFGLKNPV